MPLDYITHNRKLRGKNLTKFYTLEQINQMVQDETFFDIYIGDYILYKDPSLEKPTKWVVGGINTWKRTLVTPSVTESNFYYTKSNHLIMIADECETQLIGEKALNIQGLYGFSGSEVFSTLSSIKDTLFPSEYALDIDIKVPDRAIDRLVPRSGHQVVGRANPANSVKIKSLFKIWNLSEQDIFGCIICSSNNQDDTLSTNQLPIFELDPSFIYTSESYWLRNIANGNYMVAVNNRGMVETGHKTTDRKYVRPYFLFGKEGN